MKEVLKRLHSPVVQIQVISILVGVLVFFAPEATEAIKVVAGAMVAIINVFAGLNNPTNKKGF